MHDRENFRLPIVFGFHRSCIAKQASDFRQAGEKTTRWRRQCHRVQVARLEQIVKGLIFADIVESYARGNFDRDVLIAEHKSRATH